MERSAGTTTSLSRSLSGLAASVVAAVPLAIVFSLYGFFSSAEEHSLVEVVLGTALVVIAALIVSALGGLLFGVPVYVLAVHTRAPRAAVLVIAAALTGVIIHELWFGGELFEDIGSTMLFGFFGAYSGAAFWLGAEVWSRA